MVTIIGGLVWLGCVICAIIVLIKLFQTEGALKGILGIICLLYTFIWGWMNANKFISFFVSKIDVTGVLIFIFVPFNLKGKKRGKQKYLCFINF